MKEREEEIKNTPDYQIIKNQVYYADYEASTDENVHKPYCLSIRHKTTADKWFFTGDECTEQMLEMIPSYSLIYFHNLKYDGSFLREYIEKSVMQGNNIYALIIKYQNKLIYLKDSKKIINLPLAAFPSAFKIPSEKNYSLINYTQGKG